MKKLINFAIATIIAIAVLYALSFIVAAIVLIVIGLIRWLVKRVTPVKEYTEWEFHRDTTPLVTADANGNGMFQNQAHWVRFNNITQEWETKIVTDPVARPFSEATRLADVYNLQFR